MICFRIDELTPCLKNVETGEMDHQLFEYYQKEFGAFPVPARGRHPYTFMLTDNVTQRIREVYDYVWTDDQV